MKKTIIKFSVIVFTAILLIAIPFSGWSQPDPGCSPLECPITDPDCCVPIDGGLSLLIAAGIGLGAKKAYDRKKAAVKIAE
jgi:hypothetical protein